MRHVLLVGGGSPLPQRIRSLRDPVRTSVMVRNRNFGDVPEPGENVRVLGMRDEAPAEEWVRTAAAIHECDPFDGIGAFAEGDQDKAAAIAAKLGLRFHAVRTVESVYDKLRMRERLAAAGVETVPAVAVESADDVRAFARQVGYPVIVKPRTGTGSAGVVAVRAEPDVAEAVDWAVGTGVHGNRLVMAEPLLTGRELTVEAFSEDGVHRLVGTTQKSRSPRHYVDVGHWMPATLRTDETDLVWSHVARMLDALEIGYGPTHTELILTGAGPRVVETHIRCAGDHLPLLAQDVRGVDLYELTARQVAGERVLPVLDQQLANPATGGAAVWYAAPAARGVLVSVDNLAEAQALEGVRAIEVLVPQGSDFDGIRVSDSFGRVVGCRAVGPDGERAAQYAREALAALVFAVRCTVTDNDFD
ncbi:ATP-grasp domain-containing protein [Plantactinospora sp. BB1]|uniref:ATP-grasp domain-containing protein n=1 Tax=Plantactinospora sp. BB1 TaxID=2071627 RepID=UPI000D16C822|nr:ATP-grasp domain-containing protein [Plantactinospora sp. BB1]AVT38630.1 carboxylate--amine ligase [Plantactinospora sp. BB1]